LRSTYTVDICEGSFCAVMRGAPEKSEQKTWRSEVASFWSDLGK